MNVEVKAPHRDPLAQSFTVDGQGAFLTSFDLYFATKDPGAKVFVELRTMELGTPTSFLVQDYTQVALNPEDININTANPFEPVPTRVRFPSPVYLEAEKEYAIVILSPASDGYEMWTATMGQKTVRTTSLPDVQNVVVTKQYIGGSLFKSQNGTIWTASQFQDLTFKLYKAKFVNSGTITWYNSDITPKGTNSAVLNENPVEGLPRKLKLPITGTLVVPLFLELELFKVLLDQMLMVLLKTLVLLLQELKLMQVVLDINQIKLVLLGQNFIQLVEKELVVS